MKKNNLKPNNRILHSKKRASAEVISSLLLVAITVVGAVILTSFLDETFVAGSLSSSQSDSTIKTIKLIKYDSRDGGNLMGYQDLNNTNPVDQKLCRISCASQPNGNPGMANATEFIVIQVENQSVNPIYLHNIWLGNVTHSWDSMTGGKDLDMSDPSSVTNNGFPGDGKFSILPDDTNIPVTQRKDNQIQSGETVNLLIKLDALNPDIPLSKTLRTQFNIGANQLSDFLIESGGAQ